MEPKGEFGALEVGLAGFGFLAIIVWIIVDSFAGRKKALYSALAIGFVEVLFSFLIAGLDYITLFSFVIVVIFGLVALQKDDDYFFKVSWAVVSAFTGVAIGFVTIYLGKPLILDMFEKYGMMAMLESVYRWMAEVGGGYYEPWLMDTMKDILVVVGKHIPVWLLLHALIILVASRYNKWVWILAKTIGLFIIMAIGMIFVVISMLPQIMRGY